MKNTPYLTITAALLGMALMAPSLVRADEEKTTSTTTTSTMVSPSATISEFSPNDLEVRTSASSAPLHYVATKTTTFVDENGIPVAMETVKSGLPVTVYYDRDGDRLIATKVVVKKVAVVDPNTPPPAVQKTTTTSSTTIKKDDD